MGRIGPTEIIILFMLLLVFAVVVGVVLTRSARPATEPAPSSGRWSADPSGRHQLRWWDGGSWTASVSDDGVPSQDPLS